MKKINNLGWILLIINPYIFGVAIIYSWNLRGYVAIGGEWLLPVFVGVMSFSMITFENRQKKSDTPGSKCH